MGDVSGVRSALRDALVPRSLLRESKGPSWREAHDDLQQLSQFQVMKIREVIGMGRKVSRYDPSQVVLGSRCNPAYCPPQPLARSGKRVSEAGTRRKQAL